MQIVHLFSFAVVIQASQKPFGIQEAGQQQVHQLPSVCVSLVCLSASLREVVSATVTVTLLRIFEWHDCHNLYTIALEKEAGCGPRQVKTSYEVHIRIILLFSQTYGGTTGQ